MQLFFLYFNYKSIMQNVTVQTGRCYLNLTEVGRTRPERTMSGVVVGLSESSVPGVWHRWMEKEILWFCFRRAEPDIILSGSAGRCRQYLLLPEGFRRNERLRRVYRPRPLACGR